MNEALVYLLKMIETNKSFADCVNLTVRQYKVDKEKLIKSFDNHIGYVAYK